MVTIPEPVTLIFKFFAFNALVACDKFIFDKSGTYTITFKLIDRDNSDAIVAENSFQITVANTETIPPEEETPGNETEGTTGQENNNQQNNGEENLPSQLPKTGMNLYIPVAVIFIAIISTSLYMNMKKKNK